MWGCTVRTQGLRQGALLAGPAAVVTAVDKHLRGGLDQLCEHWGTLCCTPALASAAPGTSSHSWACCGGSLCWLCTLATLLSLLAFWETECSSMLIRFSRDPQLVGLGPTPLRARNSLCVFLVCGRNPFLELWPTWGLQEKPGVRSRH